jgi:hypothetical protein
MPDRKPLLVHTAFGSSRESTLLLAVHPDEETTPEGDPVPNRRTFVLSLKADVATFVEERPVPLARSWYSVQSGVAYCTSVATNKLYQWHSGKWTEEIFAAASIDFVPFIFGLPGAKPEEDQLFLSTEKGLFIRSQGKWTKHDLLGERFPFQIHGRRSSEVFIGGDDPLKWDGQSLTRLAPPDGDTSSALWVTEDDRLVCGKTHLSVTRPEGGWERLPLPTKNFMMLMESQDVLYAASRIGVVRVLPQPAAVVSPAMKVRRLVNVQDALIAIGEESAMVGDKSGWRTVQVPSCAAGEKL